MANIAGARYGWSDIGTYTLILKNGYQGYEDCHQYYEAVDVSYNYRLARSNVICVDDNIPFGVNTTVSEITGSFWANAELSSQRTIARTIYSERSSWFEEIRNSSDRLPLCVGD